MHKHIMYANLITSVNTFWHSLDLKPYDSSYSWSLLELKLKKLWWGTKWIIQNYETIQREKKKNQTMNPTRMQWQEVPPDLVQPIKIPKYGDSAKTWTQLIVLDQLRIPYRVQISPKPPIPSSAKLSLCLVEVGYCIWVSSCCFPSNKNPLFRDSGLVVSIYMH